MILTFSSLQRTATLKITLLIITLLCCLCETMSHIANKNSWETSPFSLGKTITFPLSKRLTKEEFEKLKMGVIPNQMEDRWFVYYEEGFAYFHRSWTGILIYKIKAEDDENGAILTQVEINNDPDQYRPNLYTTNEHIVENAEIRVALSLVAYVIRA